MGASGGREKQGSPVPCQTILAVKKGRSVSPGGPSSVPSPTRAELGPRNTLSLGEGAEEGGCCEEEEEEEEAAAPERPSLVRPLLINGFLRVVVPGSLLQGWITGSLFCRGGGGLEH